MSAALFKTLEEAGVSLSLVEGKLLAESDGEPPPALWALIGLAKRELTALLLAERAPAMWSAEDWHTHFRESARALERDCGLTRAQAETTALQDCLHLFTGRRPK
jgi:hypothetical protein